MTQLFKGILGFLSPLKLGCFLSQVMKWLGDGGEVLYKPPIVIR